MNEMESVRKKVYLRVVIYLRLSNEDRDKPKEYLEDYEDIADAINYGWYNPNKNKDKDDFEMDR